MTSNVHPLHPAPPASLPLGPLDCTWVADTASPVMSPRIRAFDSRGILVASLKIELLAAHLPRAATAELLARIIGEYEGGAWALMLEQIERDRIEREQL